MIHSVILNINYICCFRCDQLYSLEKNDFTVGKISQGMWCSTTAQGSALGPILLNLYINDIVNVSDQSKYVLFADDTNIMYSIFLEEC